MTTGISAAVIQSLEIRLLTLEHQILGASALSLEAQDGEAGPSRPSANSVTRQIANIEDKLNRPSGDSDAIKRLLAGYKQYLPFLNMGEHSATGATSDDSAIDDVISDLAKASMLIAAAPDIVVAERQLREVEVLHQNGAEGSGDLEALLPLKEVLQMKIQDRKAYSANIIQTREDVRALLRRYTDITRTTSELFVDIHRRLEDLDDGIAKVERRRRRELAERF